MLKNQIPRFLKKLVFMRQIKKNDINKKVIKTRLQHACKIAEAEVQK